MIGGSFLKRTLRNSLVMSKPRAALLLLGLLTLSGCGSECSVFSERCNQQGSGSSITKPTVKSIEITPPNPSLAVGTSMQLTATAIYSDSSSADVTAQVAWSASNTAVASVRPTDGKALAVSARSSVVTARLNSVTSASITLTVTSATLVSIAITPPASNIPLGTTQQFVATGTYTDNSTKNLTTQVTWLSATTSVATISNATGSNGLAKSVAAGSTNVMATWGGITSIPVTLTVTPTTLVSIAITPPASNIPLGTTQQFVATGTYTDNSRQDLTTRVIWASATGSVATISNGAGSNGLATSVATGNTRVVAILGILASPAVTLTVLPPTLVSITVTSIRPKITLGMTRPLTATGVYSDSSTRALTTTATWMSSAPSILSISNAAGSQGQARGAAAGSASVSAALGSVTSPLLPLTVSVAQYAYVANYADGTVSQYTIGTGGALSPMSSATIAAGTIPGGGPHSITVDLNGRYAYTANADGTLSQYTIGASGALSAMSPVTDAAGSQLYSLNVDPTGRYAYVANTDDSTVMQYTIGMGGALSAMSPASIHTGYGLTSLAVDPSGRHVYVASDSDATVSQYKIVASGSLSAMSPATVATGSRPLSVAVDPTGRYAYVANYNATSVSQYTIDAGGTLAPMNPATVAAGIRPICVTVDPTGRYVYVANDNGGFVSQFTIDASGALSPMSPATITAGRRPRSITVDPTGRYAYVANYGDGVNASTVSQFTIGTDGTLIAMSPATVAAGIKPFSIITTD